MQYIGNIVISADILYIGSTAEYCAPVWFRSAHIRLIESAINDALDTCSTQRSPVHRVQMHGATNRDPFIPAAQLISLCDSISISEAHWADHEWNAEWVDNPTRHRTFIFDTGTHPSGMTLPWTAWVRLNRLHIGVGRFCSCLYKRGMASSTACECGAEE